MTEENISAENNRRQHERLDKGFNIRYRPMEDIADSACDKEAQLCDFSAGGVRFIADEKINKNRQLLLEIEFVGWKSDGEDWVRTGEGSDIGLLKALGTVMWCAADDDGEEQYEVGVMFTGRVK